MEQQGGQSSQPLTNQQIAGEMIGLIAGPCIDSITKENVRLAADLKLIDDALTHHGVDGYMSVRSVVNALTDEKEVEKLICGVPLASHFYNNRSTVKKLVAGLSRWTAEQLFSPQDSMTKAFNILAQRREENLILLGEDPDR